MNYKHHLKRPVADTTLAQMREWVEREFSAAREKDATLAVFVVALDPDSNKIVGRVTGITNPKNDIKPENTFALETDYQKGGEYCRAIAADVWGASRVGRVIVSNWAGTAEFGDSEFSVPDNPKNLADAYAYWDLNEAVLMGILVPVPNSRATSAPFEAVTN